MRSSKLFPVEKSKLYAQELCEHYSALTTYELDKCYRDILAIAATDGPDLDAVTRKLYGLEWYVIRDILRERGVFK